MKVLVTSAGNKLPLLHAIRRQLSEAFNGVEVTAADSSSQVLSAYAWPHFLLTPRLDSEPERVVDCVLEGGFELVIPTRDADVTFLARNREFLAARGVHSFAASPNAVRACTDKLEFASKLEHVDLPVIATSLDPHDPRLGSEKLVVKERSGAGGIGTAINVSREGAIAHSQTLREPCFQPFVPGPELSLDAYRARDGQILGLIARSRDLIISGESAVSTTVDARPFARLVRDVLAALDLSGHALIQVINSTDGPLIVECNARLGGGSTLALMAGLRSLEWFALESRGERPEARPFTPVNGSLRLIRFSEDHFDASRL